ncbi:hypothetical protein [Falsiroseomonas sp.]|uniref:hypothetical protein n=1 Tax=Falsiroseomonas sp. TaxID=2870721 RepID=UPI00271718A2|nr:hypothetical protein [Falsiroseomonas sp.]MDO9501258.1 hypothetical protein [Falsiroseomonas sp.]
MSRWMILGLGWGLALLAAPAALAQGKPPVTEGGAKSQAQAPGRAPAPAPAPAPAAAPAAGGLPLQRGFYVNADTTCGRASNATLLLLRRNGIGGARDLCEFQSITAAGPDRYSVTQACRELGRDGAAETETVIFEITSRTSFRQTSPHGWSRAARFCPQRSLPAPWRDNDIRDLVR